MDGTHTTEHFLELARDLDVLEPKTPEDVYKSHLEKRPSSSSNVDSARGNLASTFVNAFVNVGFGTDKLMLSEGNKWLYKNKEHGMMSAAASLGAILQWDVDGGLTQIDKFLYSTDNNIKAGALLAVGVLHCGVRNECDPALALLTEYVEGEAPAEHPDGRPPRPRPRLRRRAPRRGARAAHARRRRPRHAARGGGGRRALARPRLRGLVPRGHLAGAAVGVDGARAGGAAGRLDDAPALRRRRAALPREAAGGRGGP